MFDVDHAPPQLAVQSLGPSAQAQENDGVARSGLTEPLVNDDPGIALPDFAPDGELGDAPGYYVVSRGLLEKLYPGKIVEFEQRQREDSKRSDARRANDTITLNLPLSWRGYVVQRTKRSVVIISEHIVALDTDRQLLIFGPVSVKGGNFSQEEVRAQRRVMLAIGRSDPRLANVRIVALTTPEASRWKDQDLLDREGLNAAAKLSKPGHSWLRKITGGADVGVFVDEECGVVPIEAPKKRSSSLLKLNVDMQSKRRFRLGFLHRR